MQYEVKYYPTGKRYQVDDKYFFVLTQYDRIAGRILPNGEETKIAVVKMLDEEQLMQNAIDQYPNSHYFNINEDYTAFLPDDVHEWMNVFWEDSL